jgi:DNA repair protein RadC
MDNYLGLLMSITGNTQIAQDIYTRFPTPRMLRGASIPELTKIYQVGSVKARQIKDALEIGAMAVLAPDTAPETIKNPADIAALVQYEMSKLEQEELWVILLNTRNVVMTIEHVYKGSVNQSQVRIAELFKEAIRRNASAIVVLHNHPSTDCTPSPEDIMLTRAIVEAGRLLDINVLDHLVIGGTHFVSLKERGLGFS